MHLRLENPYSSPQSRRFGDLTSLTLTFGLDFQYLTSYGHEPYTGQKNQGQRSVRNGNTRPIALLSPLARTVITYTYRACVWGHASKNRIASYAPYVARAMRQLVACRSSTLTLIVETYVMHAYFILRTFPD